MRLNRTAAWLAYALLLLLAPLVFDSGQAQTLLAQIGIAIIACLSFNLLLGQGGMLSFGHAVYSGSGAFLAIHTLNAVAGGLALPVSLIPLLGGLGGMALALLLGWVTTQKSGTAFAMITFGLGELVWALALLLPGWFGGEAGVSGNRVAGPPVLGITFGRQIELNYLIAGYTLLSTALLYAFTRTPAGRLLNAVRDNPQRVAFVGHNPHALRYLAFVISAFFAGVSGGLAALNFELVTAEVFSAQRSGAYLLFTVLGGTGYFFGPVLGAVLMVLSFVLLSGLTPAWLLYVGLVFVLMVMYVPGGLAAFGVRAWQRLQQGGWQRVWRTDLALTLAGLVALVGLLALVEMAYRWQQQDVLGPGLAFFGGTLNVQQPAHWLLALAALLAGLGGLMRFKLIWSGRPASIPALPRRGQGPQPEDEAARPPVGDHFRAVAAVAQVEPSAVLVAQADVPECQPPPQPAPGGGGSQAKNRLPGWRHLAMTPAPAGGGRGLETGFSVAGQASPPALELRDVCKVFGKTEVIRSLDLCVQPGERIGIIGPNGAGKSTLFDLISGRHAPTSGAVWFGGQRLDGKKPFQINRLGLSRSFQVSSLFANLSVLDNLRCAVLWSLGLRYCAWRRLARLPDVNALAQAWLQRLQLQDQRDTPAAHLSYAGQRALELGITLAGGAQVILLDEPTAGMSQSESASFVALIDAVTAGKTLLIIEHDMPVLFGLASKIAVISEGTLLAFDRPDAVRANPLVQQAYLGRVAGDA